MWFTKGWTASNDSHTSRNGHGINSCLGDVSDLQRAYCTWSLHPLWQLGLKTLEIFKKAIPSWNEGAFPKWLCPKIGYSATVAQIEWLILFPAISSPRFHLPFLKLDRIIWGCLGWVLKDPLRKGQVDRSSWRTLWLFTHPSILAGMI